MKQAITTQKASWLYKIVGQANTSKLTDSEKIALWRLSRVIHPVASKYDEAVADATNKLKPQDKDFDEILGKAQQLEAMVRGGITDQTKYPIGIAEYDKWMKEVMLPYNNNVIEAVKPYAERKVSLVYDGLTEEGFEHLFASNDWTLDFAQKLSEFIVEPTKKEKKNEK